MGGASHSGRVQPPKRRRARPLTCTTRAITRGDDARENARAPGSHSARERPSSRGLDGPVWGRRCARVRAPQCAMAAGQQGPKQKMPLLLGADSLFSVLTCVPPRDFDAVAIKGRCGEGGYGLSSPVAKSGSTPLRQHERDQK